MKFISNHIWCIHCLIYHRPGEGGVRVLTKVDKHGRAQLQPRARERMLRYSMSLSVMKRVHVHATPAVTLIDELIALM